MIFVFFGGSGRSGRLVPPLVPLERDRAAFETWRRRPGALARLLARLFRRGRA